MLRIIVIVVLGVLAVVQSGCDKIKTELERRHLASETYKETTLAASQAVKAFHVKQVNVETSSERKQIVIRIDLPADEKIQIRLIKNAAPEEMSKTYVDAPPKEDAKEVAPPKEEVPSVKPDSPIEQEKKPQTEPSEAKDLESKSEIKTGTEKESRSETKTDRDEVFSPPPLLAPTVVVPARETVFPPVLPEGQVKTALASERLEPTPAEKTVGLALSVTPPEMNASPSNKAQNAASATEKSTPSNPWAIPNADYPLRYYE